MCPENTRHHFSVQNVTIQKRLIAFSKSAAYQINRSDGNKLNLKSLIEPRNKNTHLLITYSARAKSWSPSANTQETTTAFQSPLQSQQPSKRRSTMTKKQISTKLTGKESVCTPRDRPRPTQNTVKGVQLPQCESDKQTIALERFTALTHTPLNRPKK